jgi:hypothetical protein
MIPMFYVVVSNMFGKRKPRAEPAVPRVALSAGEH